MTVQDSMQRWTLGVTNCTAKLSVEQRVSSIDDGQVNNATVVKLSLQHVATIDVAKRSQCRVHT